MANILDIPETDDFRYDPNNLMDTLIKNLNIKNDAALSRRLEVAPPVISKIRHKILPVGPNLLIRMHEESGLSIREIRALMGDRRAKFGMPDTIDFTKQREASYAAMDELAAQAQELEMGYE